MLRCRLPVALAVVLAFSGGVARAQTASVGYNFLGITNSESSFYPPDTNGAVGPNHIVFQANGRSKMFNKAGTQLNTQTLLNFWQSRVGLAATVNEFDPRVVYDRQSGRWFATANDGSDANSATLIGVSASADPTAAGWFGTRFDMDSTGTRWADFNQLAVGPTWVTITNNMFPVSTASQLVSLITIPKANLVAGSAAGLSYKENLDPNLYGFTPHPATDFYGSNATTQYTLSRYNSSSLQLSTISGSTNNPTYTDFAALINVGAGLVGVPPDAPQSGSATLVGTGDPRFSAQPVLVNGKLWAVNTVTNGTVAAIRWFRINPVSNALEATGLLPTTGGLHLYFPSIAVNQAGDIVVGYSGSNSSTFPSSYYSVGRYDGTTTTFGNPVLTFAGNAAVTFDGGRFGDYGSTNIDPADPGVFWTFQEYGTSAGSSTRWATRATEVIPTRTGEIRWQTAAAAAISTGAAWATGVAPTSADHAIYSRWSTSSYTVDATGGATYDRLSVRQTGSGTVTFNIPTGSTLSLTNTSAATPSFAVSEFQGQSNVTISGGGTLSTRHAIIAGEATGTANVTVTGAGTTWNNANDLNLGGTATSAGGSGVLNVLSGAAVNVGGTLRIYKNDATAVQVAVGAAGAAANLSVGGLTVGAGTPRVDLANANSTLTITDGLGTTFAGVVTGTGQVVKQGTGTITLTGANTYTGATAVSGGTLSLSGSGSLAASPTLTIGTGATLSAAGLTGGANFGNTTTRLALASGQTLRGTGTVDTGVIVQAGAGIRGDTGNGTGSLTVSGTAVLNGASGSGGATLTTIISDNGSSTPDSSKLATTSLNLVMSTTNKLNLVLATGANPVFNLQQQYTAVLATAAAPIQLNGVPQAGSTIFDPLAYTLTTQGISIDPAYQLALSASGQSLVLTFTPVPEPGVVLGVAALVLGIGGRVRRR